MLTKKTTILLHEDSDKELIDEIEKILEAAVELLPDSWDHITGEPGRLDHYGYHDDTLSTVVFSEEPGTRFMRLSLRPGLHPVIDRLSQAYLRYAFDVNYTKAVA